MNVHFPYCSIDNMLMFVTLLIIIVFHQRPQKYIWHGALATGERAIDLYCDAWDSDSPEKIGLASSLLNSKLLGQEKFSCNHRFAVLCIEATSQTARRRRRRNIEEERLETELKEDEYHKLLDDLLRKKD